MSTANFDEIEQRLSQLEAEVAKLKSDRPANKDWRRTIGRFSGNVAMRAIDEAAQAYREEDRSTSRNEE